MLTVAQELRELGIENIWSLSDEDFKKFVIARRIAQGRQHPDRDVIPPEEVSRRIELRKEAKKKRDAVSWANSRKAQFIHKLRALAVGRSMIMRDADRNAVSRWISSEHGNPEINTRYTTRAVSLPGGLVSIRVTRVA